MTKVHLWFGEDYADGASVEEMPEAPQVGDALAFGDGVWRVASRRWSHAPTHTAADGVRLWEDHWACIVTLHKEIG
jgi:hypothetical protein